MCILCVDFQSEYTVISVVHKKILFWFIAEDQRMSIRWRSQQFGLSGSTTWPILNKNSALKVYKVQINQKPFILQFRQWTTSLPGDVDWPPSDFTMLDFRLWRYIKLYQIPELKNEIIDVIRETDPEWCENVIENFNKRASIELQEKDILHTIFFVQEFYNWYFVQ